jgi:D-cysteine desulfhydrase family pyridoxal phosphate-dependent enzyme
MSTLARRLTELPRVSLITSPTPLEYWANLSRHLGIELYAKRDDLTGIGVGGNKLRKLEYIGGAAINLGATHLLTTGGPQRLTAAVAARLGLKCTLLLKGRWDGPFVGNLMLDSLFGANVKVIDAPDYQAIYQAMREEGNRLTSIGDVVFEIPLGGATAEGTVGYVNAFAEVASQLMEFKTVPDWMVVAVGTGSTYAGLALGAHVFSPQAKLIGISVSWKRDTLEAEVHRLLASTSILLNTKGQFPPPVRIYDDYVGPGYAQVSEDGLAAIKLLARTEGIVLDCTYTGKALAGLISLVKAGDIPRGSSVVFVHTGGLPELYTRHIEELQLRAN